MASRSRADCIEQLARKLGRRRGDVERMLGRLDDRAQELEATGLSRSEALSRARDELLSENSYRFEAAERGLALGYLLLVRTRSGKSPDPLFRALSHAMDSLPAIRRELAAQFDPLLEAELQRRLNLPDGDKDKIPPERMPMNLERFDAALQKVDDELVSKTRAVVEVFECLVAAGALRG